MDKSILYEPFSEAKKEMRKFIDEKGDKLPKEEFERSKSQHDQLAKILQMFDDNVTDKDLLMKEFDNLQQLGNFPEELLEKNSGLNNIMNSGGQGPTMPGMPENMDFEKMFAGMNMGGAPGNPDGSNPNPNNEECVIF